MAEVRPDEISAILRKQLSGFESETDIYDVGTVLQVGDGIARVYGLSQVMASELVEFPNDVFGMVLNLEEDSVGCVLFGDSSLVKEGDIVKRTKRVTSLPVGEEMLGRVITPLGVPIDGKGPINTKQFLPIERKALGVIQRQPVKEPLQTGITAIDAMIPIGRGQRELIIGDRQTGKTAVAIDAIINQKYTHYCRSKKFRYQTSLLCVCCNWSKKFYCCSGCCKTSRTWCYGLHNRYFSICFRTSTTSIYCSLFGATLGEYFRDNGKHALVIYDDLSKQAASYRELSLLLRRPPGREAYPGDVFYLAFTIT